MLSTRISNLGPIFLLHVENWFKVDLKKKLKGLGPTAYFSMANSFNKVKSYDIKNWFPW